MARALLPNSRMMRASPRKPGEWATTPARRRVILDAALECFDDKGVAATTIEEICAAAGLSVGTIYHHFSGKDDICEHLVTEAMAEYRAGLVTALGSGGDLESSLRRLVRFHLNWVDRRGPLTRLMLSWEEAERSRPAGRQHYREYREALGGWLREQVRAGRIRRMEPDLYSTLLMGPLMEHARQASAGLTTASQRVLEKGLTEGLVRVLAP